MDNFVKSICDNARKTWLDNPQWVIDNATSFACFTTFIDEETLDMMDKYEGKTVQLWDELANYSHLQEKEHIKNSKCFFAKYSHNLSDKMKSICTSL